MKTRSPAKRKNGESLTPVSSRAWGVGNVLGLGVLGRQATCHVLVQVSECRVWDLPRNAAGH